MGGQNLGFPESIDEIVAAVKETPRGRWFLEAYTSKVQSGGTASILEAITKLENNLQSMSGNVADKALLQKARDHITKARAEISGGETSPCTLSTEGQLFAKLAELSRKAFTENTNDQPGIVKNVEQALRLVADLDQELGGNPIVQDIVAPKPAPQYFKQDEEIFEPAPQPAPIKVVKPAPPIDNTPRGAKLVVKHIAQAPTETKPTDVADQIKTFGDVFEAPAAAVEMADPEPSRIIIIRRKADEPLEVPLLEDQPAQTETAA